MPCFHLRVLPLPCLLCAKVSARAIKALSVKAPLPMAAGGEEVVGLTSR